MRPLLMLPALLWSLADPLAAQTNPPASVEQLLMEAAYLGKLEEVKRLVSEGAIVDAADPEKRTSLMWAAFNGHTAVVGYLLEKGDESRREGFLSGRTALMYASSGPFRGDGRAVS